MKILVIVASYTISGVPLAQARFAKALAEAGHVVTLLFGHVPDGLSLPAVENVSVISLKKRRVMSMPMPIMRYLKNQRPEIVFSAEDHLNTVVLLAAIIARSAVMISCSSRVTPYDTYSNVPFTKRWVLKQMARSVAWRANALTCVSRDMVKQYRRVFRNSKHQYAYNIVADSSAPSRLAEEVDEEWLTRKHTPVLVSAGSLQPWKGFADLLQAMAVLKNRGRSARLLILGEGPLRQELQGLIHALGLEDRVKLLGQKSNPLKYFARADVSVLTSHVEGLPNVLVEAMLAGCTPVATNCPTGPREVLRDGRYGYLAKVGDAASIASQIEAALDRPIPSDRLAEAVAPFSSASVIRRHFELLGVSGG